MTVPDHSRPGQPNRRIQAYPGGGLNDWSLPLPDELGALHEYPAGPEVGGISSYFSWSSTFHSSSDGVFYQDFKSGSPEQHTLPVGGFGVRAARAFRPLHARDSVLPTRARQSKT